MKKAIILLCLLFAVLLLNACQTTTTGLETPVISGKTPLRTSPVDVVSAYIAPQALVPQLSPIENGDLFDNIGFEIGLDGWTGCEAGAIEESSDAYAGSKALKVNAGNCFYRSVEVSAGQDLILSCYARLQSGHGWTGMGLGFADASWTTIDGGLSTIITGNSYQRYDVEATAPAGSKYASMWFYSDNPAVVDNCSLMLEVEPPPPPPPPSSGDNLLENGDFVGLFNWSTGCSGGVGTETSGGVSIRNGGCMDQGLSASDIAELQGQDYTYSCSVKNTGGYASMSIFLDGQAKSVVIPNSTSFETIEVKGTAGNNISSGFVSLYAEGTSLIIESCSLTVDGGEPPPPPPPPPPPSGENLLENGDFASLNANNKPKNWTKGCGGVWTSAAGIDRYGLLLREGVCVDQALSNEDISKLAGKDYTFSCYIRKYDNRYASISIFLDGQSESKVIPLNDDFQLIEIKATAGQVSSGFVSIYAEAAIVVDDCSLTVEGDNVQPGTQQWFDSFGNLAEGIEESVEAIGLTSSGIYAAGSVRGTNATSNGFLRKYDRDGNVIFSQDINNGRSFVKASVDADGNSYILQTTRTPIPGRNFATLAAYVQKYSPTGTLLFDKLVKSTDYNTGGSSGAAFYTDLVVTDNALYLNGRNVGLNKLDLAGNIVWTSGTFGTVVGGLAISPDESSVYQATSGRGYTGLTLSKFNSNDGSLAWKKVIPNDYAATELVADNSHVYLMGSSRNTLTNEDTDTIDGYLWKYDSVGNQIWAKQYGTNLSDVLTRATLYDGALYATGTTDRNGFIKKINTQTAAEEWSVDINTEEYNIYNDIAVDSTGIYVGGLFADLGVVGNSQFPTNSDAFVAKYSLP